MKRFIAAALSGLGVVHAQYSAGAPAPPPRMEKAKQVDPEIERRALLEGKMSLLRSTGLKFEQGHWSYGDHRHLVESPRTPEQCPESGGRPCTITPKECADACEKDVECFHWQWTLGEDRCDLKTRGGNFAADDENHVVGHSSRWPEEERRLAAERKAEL